MKAKYTKPLLAVELFSMAQTAARECNTSIPKDELTLAEPGDCVWEMSGGTVFIAGQNCMIEGENMGVGCYNNPGEGSYVFRS